MHYKLGSMLDQCWFQLWFDSPWFFLRGYNQRCPCFRCTLFWSFKDSGIKLWWLGISEDPLCEPGSTIWMRRASMYKAWMVCRYLNRMLLSQALRRFRPDLSRRLGEELGGRKSSSGGKLLSVSSSCVYKTCFCTTYLILKLKVKVTVKTLI